MSNHNSDFFLKSLFEHILSISNGECHITEELIEKSKNPYEISVYEGLQMLHEDLELYKEELRSNLEAEYKLKILEEKNQQLEQFNYAASHDLKEPLRTISSFSTLVLRRNKDKLDEKGQEYLQYVIDSSHRMWNLVTGLLSYTALGKERNLTTVNCNELVDGICMDLTATIKDKAAIINYNDLPTLQGHVIEMRQLFQNLISNALKFAHLERPLIISISCQNSNGCYNFVVKDNGIGISEKNLESIFEIFKRIHSRSEYDGTGIGLALCKKIVQLHGGEIGVRSILNEGSEFYFTLPSSNEIFQYEIKTNV